MTKERRSPNDETPNGQRMPRDRSRIWISGFGFHSVLGISSFVIPYILAAAADRPVERETYLTGAWFAPRSEAEREMYLKGGFTLVQYTAHCRDWAVAKGLKFIGHVSSRGLPRNVARPFEDAEGTQSMSVGLFTHVNFNAPSVEAWWKESVPKQVRATPHAEHVRFWKVHNEFGYHSWKLYDYSPGSLARYRTWLKGRHADVAELNRRWGTDFAGLDSVEPPRTRAEMRDQLANWLEWRRFTCWNFADYFRTSGDLIRTVVPGAPVSDNYYTTSPLQGWDNFELARQTDYLGYDIYDASRWDRLLAKLEHARCGAGAWDKPFVIIEYHAGPNNWITRVTHRDLTIEAFTALARECRAIQWFRWIPGKGGREQGIHGMMDDQGRPTERFTAAAQVSAFCQRLAPLLHRSRTRSDIALLTSSDSAYLAYARKQSVHAARARWDRFNVVLSAAGLQCDQVNPTVLVECDLSRYKVVIAGHVEVVPRAAMSALRRFADAGGTVVLHPDTGLLDEYGREVEPSPYSKAAATRGLWPARTRLDGRGPISVEPVGRGRIVHCAWEMPRQRPTPDALSAMGQAYRELLANHAELSPAWRAEGVSLTEDLDVRVLGTDAGTLVVASWLGEGSVTPALTLPGLTRPAPAYLLHSETAAVKPLSSRVTDAGLQLDRIELDPCAMILIADRPWQPLVGVDAPRVLHPGEQATVTVTVDNLGSEAVSGHLALDAPAGWTVSTLGQPRFADLQPSARATCGFRVHVPPDAPIDHFAIDHPLTGRLTLDKGRSGELIAKHLPKLLPVLDLRVKYQGHELTPWQEMSPPILRWGWDREVHVPPPPPLSVGADCPVTVRFRAASALVGRDVRLALSGVPGATVRPATVQLTSADQTMDLTLSIPRPGEATLVATVGDMIARGVMQAGMHTETVEAALSRTPAPPAGWTPVAALVAGVRDAPAGGTPVSFNLDHALPAPGSLYVLDSAGQPVAACIGERSVTLALDCAKDTVSTYVIARPQDAQSRPPRPERVRVSQPDEATIQVRGDAYAVCIDTELGIVRWMETGGVRSVRHRTGVIARGEQGESYEPGVHGSVVGLALEGSAVRAGLELSRRQRELEIREKWGFEAGRIDVEVRLVNRASHPIALADLSYELGLAPDALPSWRRLSSDGTKTRGTFPSGFGPLRNARVFDFTDANGAGLALVLGRCALITKWHSGFSGVRHNPFRTSIGLFRGLRLDPGDTILAEFALLPHAQATIDVSQPTIETAQRSLYSPVQ